MLMHSLRSRTVRTGFRYRTMPEVNTLESRLALSLARPGLRAAAASDVIAFRGSMTTGMLDIQGTSGADTVEIGRSARGFVTLTIDGVVRSGDLRDRGAFDRRLSGLRVDQIRSVRLIGSDPLDSVVLNTVLGTSARPARIQSNAVAIAAPVNQTGTLRIDARTITVSAAVRADAIVLSASGLLNLEAGGSLTASKSIDLKADRLIQTGNLAAPAVTVSAAVVIRSGTISAPGGAVNVDFRENYVATEGATIDVSARAGNGGSIRVDGGATGHLFNSGTLRATGTGSGGAVRLSGRDVVWIAGGADASGGAAGGRIHVGGGWQGSDASMTKARTLQISPHTSLKADGATQGGTVVLWSEEATTNYATVSATGAKGGAVEVSSKASLSHGGAVDVGPGGKFLLDPKYIVIADSPMSAVPKFQLVNPTPNPNDSFGASFSGTPIQTLSTGNIVVVDPYDDAVAPDAGAVYLYNGASGALISTLTGTSSGDNVGFNGVTALNFGNYVVQTQTWNSNRGAATWDSGSVGVSGTVSSGNSLVGSTTNDYVGINVTPLTNGNYVVGSSNWSSSTESYVGAVTWGNGTVGVAGVVSAANSLVGSTSFDQVGANGVKALSNGNYVVQSQSWQGPTDFGSAATWGDGTVGVKGEVSASNSLIGVYSVTLLTNGNYVAANMNWGGNFGAVTWVNGAVGLSGLVSASNSLVGSAGEAVGSGGVTTLANGSYVVISPAWGGGRGAFTWGSGSATTAGVVDATNSLVGTTASDAVDSVVKVLSDSDYVVISPYWDNGPATDAGAVTWGSGTAGVSGVISPSISLVGSSTNDFVGGGGVTALTNGNYVVRSENWDDVGEGLTDAGAVTWGNGATGVAGTITAGNSLIGSTNSYQLIGSGGVTALTNGNYVVSSPVWNVGKGAVTWGDGATGVTGFVTAGNSLVGSTDNQPVGSGGVTALSNGNYVVSSPMWNNYFGAVTWGNGSGGTVGPVSAGNSLVGTAIDFNGHVVKGLSDGDYVVISASWNNGAAVAAGAVTWGNGMAGVVGPISSSNSLVGSTAYDQVGYGGVTELTNGNYVVRSTFWDNGPATDAGAVTWGNGTTGTTGTITAGNSLVGTAASSPVGSGGVTALTNGNYVVVSSNWDNGPATDAGAVTWGNGTSGSTGSISAANSLVGSTPFSFVGNGGVTALANGNYLVLSQNWYGPTSTNQGALTWVIGSDGKVATGSVGGEVSTNNSFVNTGPAPQTQPGDDTYLIRYPADGGVIYFGIQESMPVVATFSSNPSMTASMGPNFVAAPLNAGTATTLQANSDITVANSLTVNNPSGTGGAITLQAGRSVTFNANLTTDGGNLTVLANASASDGVVDAQRDAGAGGVVIAQGVSIDAGTGAVSLSSGAATGLTQRTSGGVSVSGNVTASSVAIATASSGSGAPDVSISGALNSTGAGGIAVNSAGAFSISSSGSLVSSASGAPITVTASALALRNSIQTNGGNATFTGPATLSSFFSASTGSGTLSFTDGLAIGAFAIVVMSPTAASVGGTLSVNGGVIMASAGGVAVGSAGSLTGNGTFLGPVSVAGGLAPGSGSTGSGVGALTLSTGALTLAGTTTVSLNGTSKTAFDKIIAQGANLAGATLSLDLSAATLNAGDSVTLVDNVSGSATGGTFARLAQGALFTADGHTMQISYTGGDGNDVIVTKVSDITASFSVNRSGFMYVDDLDAYWQSITLTNTSLTVKKPRTLKFVGLPDRVSVLGGTKTGSDWFLNVGEPSVSPTGSVGLPVYFQVTSGGAFTYSLEVIGG